MDHRWGHRIPVDLDVQIACGHVGGGGRLEDVSLSGAFLRTALRVPVLSRLRIIAEGCDAAAFVVRHARTGMGLEWIDDGADVLACVLAQSPRLGQSARLAMPRLDSNRLGC